MNIIHTITTQSMIFPKSENYSNVTIMNNTTNTFSNRTQDIVKTCTNC